MVARCRTGATRGGRCVPFDRRLLKRAVATRWTLLVNVAAGLAGTLLLLATVAGIVAARAGLVQAVELSGRRAATRLLSALRAELVEHRLRPGAGGPGGSGGAELAAGTVQGVDGLETYFARYLPQTVLAVVVPLAVLCWCAAVDLTSALIMAVTLPVMPVFMALIGRSAEARVTCLAAGSTATTSPIRTATLGWLRDGLRRLVATSEEASWQVASWYSSGWNWW
jgi:ABC-type transport system involved in cytochrome bd biosynthesis fused ATPase/permease subunit